MLLLTGDTRRVTFDILQIDTKGGMIVARIGIYAKHPQMLIVAYDLRKTNSMDADERSEDYESIKEVMESKALGEAAHIQYSVWILATRLTPEAVADRLLNQLEEHDRLFVGQLEAMYSYNLPQPAGELFDRTWPKE